MAQAGRWPSGKSELRLADMPERFPKNEALPQMREAWPRIRPEDKRAVVAELRRRGWKDSDLRACNISVHR